jgi:RNA polymerase sigma factor (TIGR02999 family)
LNQHLIDPFRRIHRSAISCCVLSQYREVVVETVIAVRKNLRCYNPIVMSAREPGDISRLLAAWNGGNEGALEELIPIVYPELRRIARIHLARRASDDTLESAALVNEAYLKLVRSQGIECHNRAHFFAVCAQMIRRILVDHARNRRYAKRGGSLVHVSIDDALLGTRARGVDILALDEVLTSLAKVSARKVQVVEMRFFGGLSVEETAKVLGVSPETVMRDWSFAKAWLVSRLKGC